MCVCVSVCLSVTMKSTTCTYIYNVPHLFSKQGSIGFTPNTLCPLLSLSTGIIHYRISTWNCYGVNLKSPALNLCHKSCISITRTDVDIVDYVVYMIYGADYCTFVFLLKIWLLCIAQCLEPIFNIKYLHVAVCVLLCVVLKIFFFYL